MRQGRTILAWFFAVDYKQVQIAARGNPHRPGRALSEAGIDVPFPEIQRFHDMHIGIDDLETVFHTNPSSLRSCSSRSKRSIASLRSNRPSAAIFRTTTLAALLSMAGQNY